MKAVSLCKDILKDFGHIFCHRVFELKRSESETRGPESNNILELEQPFLKFELTMPISRSAKKDLEYNLTELSYSID